VTPCHGDFILFYFICQGGKDGVSKLAVLNTDVISLFVKVILIDICLVGKAVRRILTELK
jgi:hypothetical protein